MRSHPGMFTSQAKQWDPEEVLGLTNPDRGYVTCTAEAVTYGRRCRRAQNKIHEAARLLQDMATMDPLSVAKSDRLFSIASMSVCYQHGGQANSVYREWKSALQALGTCRKVRPGPQSPQTFIKREPDSEDEDAQWLTSEATQQSYSKADIRALLDQLRRMQEEFDKIRIEKERIAEEQKRKQEEEERLKKERAERARRQREEEEERQRKEQERKEKERKERENREREERIKERIRKRNEMARKEWTDSWQEYLEAWDHLKDKSCREAAPILIPWPVKSGKWEDVTVENVKLFFQKAPPMSSNTKEEKFRLMSLENKRWHTDKIMSLFGSEIISGKYGEALSLVAKLVIQLRQDAQKARKD